MTLFESGDPRPIHFMGIAGAGMSGLALLARHQGAAVTGCDKDPQGAADLAALGVEIWRGHDPGHVSGARAVVVTAAVPREHPELEQAGALGIPVVRRADALGQAVANGTDRKSTRLNSSHSQISYAVFCFKKKKTKSRRASSRLTIDI